MQRPDEKRPLGRCHASYLGTVKLVVFFSQGSLTSVRVDKERVQAYQDADVEQGSASFPY